MDRLREKAEAIRVQLFKVLKLTNLNNPIWPLDPGQWTQATSPEAGSMDSYPCGKQEGPFSCLGLFRGTNGPC